MELELVTLQDSFYNMEFDIASAEITQEGKEGKEYDLNNPATIDELFETMKTLSVENVWTEIILFSQTEDEDTIYSTIVFPIDCKQGYTAVVFYDETKSCVYIPYNEKYKDSDEIAPVLFGGKNEVSKANTFDDIDEVIAFFKYIVINKKIPTDSKLKWAKDVIAQ